jgi:hypothetical protein
MILHPPSASWKINQIMKYSRQIFAHIFVAACLAPKFATAQSDSPAAPGSCTYWDFETHLLSGSSSVLPPSVKETLMEMEMQQKKSSRSNDDKVSSFFFILGSNQDPEYMKTQIKIFLSSFNIAVEVVDEEENDDMYGIDLPGVSLESLPYGPFEFAYFLEKGFGLKVAEPNLVYDDSFYPAEEQDERLDVSRRSISGGNGPDKGVMDGDSCDDPNNKEWHLKHIKAPEAWDFSEQKGKPSHGEGVVIAQIDTGYSDHRAFTDDMWYNTSAKGFNMFGGGKNSKDPKDTIRTLVFQPGHGTLVAPHAVGRGNVEMHNFTTGKISLGGMSPRGTAPKAKLYSIRAVRNPVLDWFDVGRVCNALKAIVKEENINVDVISMSLGTFSFGSRHFKALRWIKKAVDKNIIVIAAGGQFAPISNIASVSYPAAFPKVIAVGGYQIANTKKGDKLFHERNMEWWPDGFSGQKIDISGPANDVCNAKIKSEGDIVNYTTYREGRGTSLATAMTGGVAALWLAHHGKGDLIQHFNKDNITLQVAFKKVLELAANNKEGWEDGDSEKNEYLPKYGHGMIDAEAILKISLNEITSKVLTSKSRRLVGQERALEEESEEAAAHKDMMDLLLETGYDEDTLKLLQGNKDDLEHFFTELVYMKSKDDAVMSSVLRAKLGQD